MKAARSLLSEADSESRLHCTLKLVPFGAENATAGPEVALWDVSTQAALQPLWGTEESRTVCVGAELPLIHPEPGGRGGSSGSGQFLGSEKRNCNEHGLGARSAGSVASGSSKSVSGRGEYNYCRCQGAWQMS